MNQIRLLGVSLLLLLGAIGVMRAIESPPTERNPNVARRPRPKQSDSDEGPINLGELEERKRIWREGLSGH